MNQESKRSIEAAKASVAAEANLGDHVVVPLPGCGTRLPLFLVHGVDGDLRHVTSLAASLSVDRPVFGVRSFVLARRRVALTTVEQMAQFYLAEIRKVQPVGPYYFIGFSFGGFIAYEMAQTLLACGEPVGMLGMIDSLVMGRAALNGHAGPTQPQPDAAEPVHRPVPRFSDHLKKLMSPGGLRYAADKIVRRGYRFTYMGFEKMQRPVPRFLLRPEDLNWYAGARYAPRPYPGKVTLFFSDESIQDGRAMVDFWQGVAPEAEIRHIEGPHGDLMWQPRVQVVARMVDESLASAP